MSDPDVRIVRLGRGDDAAVERAAHLFDEPPKPGQTARFLEQPGHHLLVAYVGDGAPAGFATGIETLHPDKEPELCLYEIGVDDAYRRRGIGRALIRAIGDLARELGCSSVYVLTEAGNEAALATYAFGGVEREDGIVSFTWRPPPG